MYSCEMRLTGGTQIETVDNFKISEVILTISQFEIAPRTNFMTERMFSLERQKYKREFGFLLNRYLEIIPEILNKF